MNEKGWDSGNSGGRARGLTDNMRERRMEDESEVLLLTPSGRSLPSQKTPTGMQALMGSGYLLSCSPVPATAGGAVNGEGSVKLRALWE